MEISNVHYCLSLSSCTPAFPPAKTQGFNSGCGNFYLLVFGVLVRVYKTRGVESNM